LIRFSASGSRGADTALSTRGASTEAAGAGAGVGFSGSGGGVRRAGCVVGGTRGGGATGASATGDDTNGSSSIGANTRDGGCGVANGGPSGTVSARAFAHPPASAADKAHIARLSAQRRFTIDERWEHIVRIISWSVKSRSLAGAGRGMSFPALELTVPRLRRRASE